MWPAKGICVMTGRRYSPPSNLRRDRMRSYVFATTLLACCAQSILLGQERAQEGGSESPPRAVSTADGGESKSPAGSRKGLSEAAQAAKDSFVAPTQADVEGVIAELQSSLGGSTATWVTPQTDRPGGNISNWTRFGRSLAPGQRPSESPCRVPRPLLRRSARFGAFAVCRRSKKS